MAETIRTRTFSKDGVVYTLTDDGYRIRFTQKGGGRNVDIDEEFIWAEYKQCDLPRAGEAIAGLLMNSALTPACSFCGERGHTFSSCPMPRNRTPPAELPSRGAVALKVLSAWLSNPEVFWDDGEDSPNADYYTRMAKHAYMAADAFLAVSGDTAPGVNIDGMPPNTSLSDDGKTVTYHSEKKDPWAQRARRKTK